jgi:hypothetical protein
MFTFIFIGQSKYFFFGYLGRNNKLAEYNQILSCEVQALPLLVGMLYTTDLYKLPFFAQKQSNIN